VSSRRPSIAVVRSAGDSLRAAADLVDLVLDEPVPEEVELGPGRRVPVVDVRSDLPPGDGARTADLVVAALQIPADAEVVLLTDDPVAAREALDVVATLRAEASAADGGDGS